MLGVIQPGEIQRFCDFNFSHAQGHMNRVR